MRMKGQVALVTGGAAGIGLGIARAFVREGAAVALADIEGEAASARADEIEQAGGQALGVAMDVTDEGSVTAGTDRVVERFGRLDVLVSNAGVQHIDPIDKLSYADWRRVTAIHLDGAFLTTKAALKHMYAQESGSVIYMGSVHSKEASPLKAPYISAKHGIMGLARTLTREAAAHNVRVNVIAPGFVRTELVERQIPQQAQELGISEDEVVRNVMLKNTVDGAFTTIEDVAELAVTLASFPSNALTGQSIVASHGWHMQ